VLVLRRIGGLRKGELRSGRLAYHRLVVVALGVAFAHSDAHGFFVSSLFFSVFVRWG